MMQDSKKCFGDPTISEKENHLIYRYRFQKSMKEWSKSFYEVDFSTHKDCTIGEIWEEFDKSADDMPKLKGPIFSYCYVYRGDGWWSNVSIIPINNKDESMPYWVRND